MRARTRAIAAALVAAIAVSVPGSSTAAPRASPGRWYAFAPYVDFAGYPVPRLTAIRRGNGARDLTLGFVTAQGSSGCTPSWGGYATYPASGAHAYQRGAIASFTRAGGGIVPSFGGEAGTDLATSCPSVATLRQAYAAVIAAYHVDHLDFDIEGADVANLAAARRRAAALSALQLAAVQSGHRLRVALTLPVLPTGLTPDGMRILRTTLSGGVSVSLVNGMAMDYGDSAAPHPAGRMGAYATSVADHLRTQLGAALPALSRSSVERLIGITPMIGINDTSDEVFGLDDARQLAAYASKHHLGTLSFWQAERDRQCPTPSAVAQLTCSSVAQTPWQFSRILRER